MKAARARGHITESADGDIVFRQFQLRPSCKLLLRGGKLVDIGSRAFDLLYFLAKSPGTLVTKQSIIRYVWPSTCVEESNLRFQLCALRKALAEDRDVIKTIPGRGYLFVPDAVSESAPTSVSCINDSDRPTVVIIEDDCHVRDALENLLLSTGLRVEAFDSISSFTSSQRLSAPSCFVLDVWLPGESGLDFQMELARAGLNAPVIFISGDADIPMSVRAMKAGAVEFLTKPVHHQHLLNAINLAIAPEGR